MPEKRIIILELDENDFDSVQEAMGVRQSFQVMPDGGGNLAGRLIAEVCRGWLEMLNTKPREE